MIGTLGQSLGEIDTVTDGPIPEGMRFAGGRIADGTDYAELAGHPPEKYIDQRHQQYKRR